MDNFAIDLDQALNELERLETEDEQKHLNETDTLQNKNALYLKQINSKTNCDDVVNNLLDASKNINGISNQDNSDADVNVTSVNLRTNFYENKSIENNSEKKAVNSNQSIELNDKDNEEQNEFDDLMKSLVVENRDLLSLSQKIDETNIKNSFSLNKEKKEEDSDVTSFSQVKLNEDNFANIVDINLNELNIDDKNNNSNILKNIDLLKAAKSDPESCETNFEDGEFFLNEDTQFEVGLVMSNILSQIESLINDEIMITKSNIETILSNKIDLIEINMSANQLDNISVENESNVNQITESIIKEEQDVHSNLITESNSQNQNKEGQKENESEEIKQYDEPTSSKINQKAVITPENLSDELIRLDGESIQVVDFQTEWEQLTEAEKMLGVLAPTWLLDSETEICMKCSAKFSFRKRRHHCRACGLIFCSNCCNSKIELLFKTTKTNIATNQNPTDQNLGVTSQGELSRVCTVCYETIKRVNDLKANIEKMSSKATIPIVSALKKRPSIRKASSEYNSCTSNHNNDEINDDSLARRTEASGSLSRSKSVRFSDGIAPAKFDSQSTDTNNENCLDFSNIPGYSINSLKNNKDNKVKTDEELNFDIGTDYTTKLTQQPKSNKLDSVIRQSRFIEDKIINNLKLHYITYNILPPILIKSNKKIKDEIIDAANPKFDETKFIKELLLSNESDNAVSFMLLRNLKVFVRIIDLSYCNYGKCWLFVTSGLCINAQDELVFILKCTTDESMKFNEDQVPRQILYHIMDIFDKSSKGIRIAPMNHVLYDFESAKIVTDILNTNINFKSRIPISNEQYESSVLLNNGENVGFIYFQPNNFHFRSILNKIAHYLPDDPFLIGYIIHRWEVPFAKLFPLRLALRLGEQLDFYPCPIVNDRFRKSVYGEIGHTIMNLLSDTRNFQYTIPQIDGLYIHMEGSHTRIIIPESQYDFIIKSLLTSNDYVFSLASLQIDDTLPKYLVASENEHLGSYSSNIIEFKSNETEENSDSFSKTTGAAFVVFNGAFKTSLTLNAKLTTVEDGIMIQIDSDMMKQLKQSLQEMKPFRIECNKPVTNQMNNLINKTQSNQDNNIITIEWIKNDNHINKRVFSIIDAKPMIGVKSLRLTNTYDYANETNSIRWTEVYLIQIEEESNALNESNFNLKRFADMCSEACCTALVPLLNDLVMMHKIYLTKKRLSLKNSNPNPSIDASMLPKILNPFKIALRLEVNKDQCGYIIGMDGSQILEDKFLSSLDNELIPLLNQASSSNMSILLELIFYIQERFNCTNQI